MATLATAGCRRASEGAPLVVVIGDGRPTLGDPLKPPENSAQAVLRQATAQGLVKFDDAGQIEPGLAERWNVSDDGLSYIFRLATGKWPDGRKIMARDVARLIARQINADGDSATRDATGAVDKVLAMTDRVVEIRLRAPRPNLLALLAQPDFALIREGAGTGPFQPVADQAKRAEDAPLRLVRQLPSTDGEGAVRDEVDLAAMSAGKAIVAFIRDRASLVLGGTLDDLPLAQHAKLQRGTLQFDPVAGLFGLVPARVGGLLAKPEVRQILSHAIDRQALLTGLAVPGLTPRATLLEAGLNGVGNPVQPSWLTTPMPERQATLAAALRRELELKPDDPMPSLVIGLPTGPGGDYLFARLKHDWGALGIAVERADSDTQADFTLIDEVAPSDSPAWFLRHFRCARVPVCDKDADELLAAARAASSPAQRGALLGQAAARMDEAALFLPIAAPIRWSLVDRRLPGFTPNRNARHPLSGLTAQTGQGGPQ